ncbi:MAG: VOC family protein [Bacteroidota bacterium]
MEEQMEPQSEIVPVVQVRNMGIIAIHVSDIARSARFYKEILGFREGEQMLSPGLSLEANDISIYLCNGRAPRRKEQMQYAEISLCFVVKGVKDAFDKLTAAGVEVMEPYEAGSEYFATCAIADPDGNMIEIWGNP